MSSIRSVHGLIGCLLVAPGLVAPAAQGAEPSFHVARIPLDGEPTSLELGDLDGDGALDLVVGEPVSGTFRVFRGERVRFLPGGSFPTPGGPDVVHVADVDGDARSDVVTLSAAGNTVAIFIGDGSGGFAPPVVQVAGARPVAVASGDLDLDGVTDLVISNWDGGTVSMLRGTGGGSFAPAVHHPCGNHPRELAIGDLDRDGSPDVVVARESASPLVLWNLGGATSIAEPGSGSGPVIPSSDEPEHSTAAVYSVSLDVGDVDRDGDLDVLTVNTNQSGLVLLRNDGRGVFAAESYGQTGRQGVRYAPGADRDLAVVWGAETITLFPLWTAIPWGTLGDVRPTPRWTSTQDVAAADLNEDGLLDLVALGGRVASWTLPGVSIVYGRPDAMRGVHTVVWGMSVPAFRLADLDGDGDDDPVMVQKHCAHPPGGYLISARANGSWRLYPSHQVGVSNPCSGGIDVADFDGDGKVDAAAILDGDPFIFRGDGLGGFAEAIHAATGASGGPLVAGDFTGDGVPDLLVGSRLGRGNGNGTLSWLGWFMGSGKGAAAYLDGNAGLDLVRISGDDVRVWLNSGAGAFGPATDHFAGYGAQDLIVVDVDLDGALDLVTSNSDEASVSILRGRGDGTFEPRLTVPTSPHPRAVAVTDLNNDGIQDLLTIGPSGLELRWGSGGFHFAPSVQAFEPYVTQQSEADIEVADLDLDGSQDVLVASGMYADVYGYFAVLENLVPSGPLAVPPRPADRLDLAISPQPARFRASVAFTQPREARTRLEVFDVSGRHTATLFDGLAPAGTSTARWDGRTRQGDVAPAGVYLVRCSSHGVQVSRRMVWLGL